MNQFIAIDIGGTQIKYGLISQNGEVLSNGEISSPVKAAPEEFISVLGGIIDKNISDSVKGIGIATLGTVDQQKGMVTGACDNFQLLKNLPIKLKLEEKYRIPVSVINDVDAAALGEAWFGKCSELNRFYCLTYGTGIGGALVINRSVYKGANNAEGEVGYLWNCRGDSYEKIASAKAFSDQCSVINNGNGRVLTEALEGSEKYKSILDSWITGLACGITDIIYMLDPGTIVIGGAVSGIGELFTDRVQKEVDSLILGDYKGKTRIIPASFGNTSNMLGAITPLL